MPCDTFTDWKSNLRAIAKSLEALRLVNRYGVTQCGEQYQGFAALPEPAPTRPRNDFTGEVDAAVWLNSVVVKEYDVNLLDGDPSKRKRAYQIAARLLHPDTPGTGNDEKFRLLQKAKEILGIK
jgi:hypothetical protein